MRLDHLTVAELDALIARAQQTRTHRRALEELRAQGWRYVNEGGAPHRVLEEAAGAVGLDSGPVVAGADAALPERDEGEPWEQPVGPATAYAMGAIVTHNGRTWRSLLSINVQEPGNSADPQWWRWWENITEGEGPDDTQWNPHGHEYSVGDRVEYGGAEYECIQPHTSQPGWTPDAVPALWKLIEGDN